MPRSSLVLFALFFAGLAAAGAARSYSPSAPPLAPQAGREDSSHPADARQADINPRSPARLTIPSIRLDTAVVAVGVNKEGEMDVPDGRTKNVGWYKDGAAPGEVGSAVMDAHVYAAFANLRYLKIGSDIYVTNASGEKLHFKVTDSRVYALGELPLDLLFNQRDAKRLNLITCAGKFVRKLNTYDHRLVAYATLVEE